MRLILRILATAVVAVLGLLLIGPQQLGGPAAAVSTFGESMLPTYRPHHLVVVGRDTGYEVGQVVAYRSDTLDTVVLHRIVAGDAGSWITKGDNNDWLDPDRPTDDDIIGRVWFGVPFLGRLLEQSTLVRVLLPLAVTGGIMFATRPRRSRDERSARRSRRPAGGRPDLTTRGAVLWAGRPRRLGAVAAALVVVGAVLAVGAWSRPLTVPGTIEYAHGGEFSYEAVVAPGAVYPDGLVDLGDPIFLRLADRLDVAYDWVFTSGAPARLRGTGQLVAIVEDGSGWRTSLAIGPVTEWTGTEASLTGELDFAEIRRMTARAAESTGVSTASRTVTVVAETAVDGEVGGLDVSSRAESSLAFAVDDLRAQVVGPADGGAEGAPLADGGTGSVTAPGLEPAQLSVAGRGLSVAVARPTSIVLLALGLVLAAAATVLARRTRSWDQHRRIEVRHPGVIVPIDGLSTSDDKSMVAVPTIDQLVDLAHHRDLPVLRVPTQDGGMLYVADDASAQYRFIVRPARSDASSSGAERATSQTWRPPPPTRPPPPPPPQAGEDGAPLVAQHGSAR